jgi:hypothetical protein
MSRSFFSWRLAGFAAILSLVAALVLLAPVAWAGPGYRPDGVKPSIALSGEIPAGVAVDQSSQLIYVAEVSESLVDVKPGLIEQLSPAGAPTADSPFQTGGQDFFASVAVDPASHDVYAYQVEGSTPQGQKGTPKVSRFSSTGVLGSSFSLANAQAGTLAVDSSGRLLFPNNIAGSVQIFSSAGALTATVTCAGCPGGAFVKPQAVAFDSAGKLYVVDGGGSGRVLRFSPSGSSYAYEATLQSGKGAVAVAVDVSSDDVFVGDLVGGKYHVVAYDSAGVEFDDFAAEAATKSEIEVVIGQLAVNSTTHDVYLSDPGGDQLRVFERIASIPAPTATIAAPSPVGQVEATLNASVDPKGHVLTSCGFEYTNHADFLANGYANAKTAPCPALVGTPGATTISAGVKGLAAATSYDYRVKVESHGGAAESGSQSFQTLPPLPPEVTTGTASALTKTTAMLGGTVNPKGGAVSNCHFEYVTEASFQSAGFSGAVLKSCLLTPSGNAPVAVSAKVTGLEAGTAYRFRLVVTNNSGTTQATDASFTTVAETCAENPAFCPPAETPQSPSSPAPTTPTVVIPPPAPQPKPLKCRKGFKKKKVRGKLKCVRIKKHRPKH